MEGPGYIINKDKVLTNIVIEFFVKIYKWMSFQKIIVMFVYVFIYQSHFKLFIFSKLSFTTIHIKYSFTQIF